MSQGENNRVMLGNVTRIYEILGKTLSALIVNVP